METSILQQIKKRAGTLIEPSLLKPGTVLEVRRWEPLSMVEIDLHLPFADMSVWSEIPYIKFRVAELTFRDYTPFGWDADTRTCTLIIDAAHKGPGSEWAKKLQKKDTIHYLKTDTTHQTPDATSLVVGLGDESSMAHLLALQQMTLPVTRFEGALLVDNSEHRRLFGEYFKSPLQAIARRDDYGHHSLMDWVNEQGYCFAHTFFYLTGNNVQVSQLRKLLKQKGHPGDKIKVKGFWE
jgi:NADPH-dependent ferric siderophore reductase